MSEQILEFLELQCASESMCDTVVPPASADAALTA